jgi:hypothetical protein
MVKAVARCACCGGAVDHEGRTLSPVLPPADARPAPAVRAPHVTPDDDPLTHLSPVERFNKAIARRDRARAKRPR